MPRVLKTDVHVAGRRFGAGTTPPDEYARQITNPSAWAGDPDPQPEPQEANTGVSSSVPNDNDTSGLGEKTRIVAGEPTVSLSGPEPRTGTGGTDPGAHHLKAPPRTGRGSGVYSWLAFARMHGIDMRDDAERGDVIDACIDAGLIEP